MFRSAVVLLVGSLVGVISSGQASPNEHGSVALSGAPLTAKYRALSIVGQGEEIFFLFETRPSSVGNSAAGTMAGTARQSVSVQSVAPSANIIQVLRTAVESDEISESQAEQIFIELSERTGARYQLPQTRREIMTSLGFPEGTVMLATNWFEMAAVHLEMSLSISSLSSRFVLHALGVKSAVVDSVASSDAEADAEAAKVVEEINATILAPMKVPVAVEPAVSAVVEPAVSASKPAHERPVKVESDPVVVEADRNPLALEAASESGNFVTKPALK